MEYGIEWENERVRVARVRIEAGEEVGLHRDEAPHVVVALEGGVIRRFEPDGSIVDVEFPTGKAVYRDTDPPDQLHKSMNISNNAVELILIELKEHFATPPPRQPAKGWAI